MLVLLVVDVLAGGSADVYAEGELCVRMLVLLVVDVPHKGWHHLWVPQAHLVANEPELGSDLYEGLHLRIRVFFVFFFHWGGPCFHSEHIGRVDRFYCNLIPFLDGNHCDLLLLLGLLGKLDKRARRRWDEVLLCAFRCCLTGVHLHHQAGEARRLEVLKRICRVHLEVLLRQRTDKRLDTAFHEPRPGCFDVFACGGADMHTEGELCVRVFVLLVADVPHKGWHHLWVPQAHLVANELELGSDLNEGLDLRLRILRVRIIHCAGARFHSEDVCNLSLLNCNLIPFFDGDHCDLLLGLLLPGHPGRPEQQGCGQQEDCYCVSCSHAFPTQLKRCTPHRS